MLAPCLLGFVLVSHSVSPLDRHALRAVCALRLHCRATPCTKCPTPAMPVSCQVPVRSRARVGQSMLIARCMFGTGSRACAKRTLPGRIVSLLPLRLACGAACSIWRRVSVLWAVQEAQKAKRAKPAAAAGRTTRTAAKRGSTPMAGGVPHASAPPLPHDPSMPRERPAST